MVEEINKVMLVDGMVTEHPEYEGTLLKADEIDEGGALSSLPIDVLLTEDASEYLDVNIEEMDDKAIVNCTKPFAHMGF